MMHNDDDNDSDSDMAAKPNSTDSADLHIHHRTVTFDLEPKVYHIEHPATAVEQVVHEIYDLHALKQKFVRLQKRVDTFDEFFDDADVAEIRSRIRTVGNNIAAKQQILSSKGNMAVEMKFTCDVRRQVLEETLSGIPEDDQLYKFFVQKQIDLQNKTKLVVDQVKPEQK